MKKIWFLAGIGSSTVISYFYYTGRYLSWFKGILTQMPAFITQPERWLQSKAPVVAQYMPMLLLAVIFVPCIVVPLHFIFRLSYLQSIRLSALLAGLLVFMTMIFPFAADLLPHTLHRFTPEFLTAFFSPLTFIIPFISLRLQLLLKAG
jgi:hypothetical protein